MLLGVLVVVDANKEDVTRIVGHCLWVVAGLYLADGRLCILVVFQLYHECWGRDMLSGDEY